MQPAILSLDIGTSIVKSVMFDTDGREIALSEHPCPLLTPHPGYAEQDPVELFNAVLKVIVESVEQLPDGMPIAAAVLSTQGGSTVPVDEQGKPLHPIITWLDQRAANLVDRWKHEGLDRWIRKLSGWGPQPGLPLSVICSLREDQPDIHDSASMFLSVNDYITHRLTGNLITNPSMAGEMLLTDVHTGEYSEDLCSFAGIHIEQLSPIQPSDSISGSILPEICSRTGLPEGTPLINGGQDHSCEALALGLTRPGSFLLACGTAWVINAVTASADVEALPPRMALNPHVLPGRWIASEFLGGLGAGMEWWLEQFWQLASGASRSGRFTAFNKALENTSPGSGGLFFAPVSGTPRTGSSSGGFLRLRLDHSAADMGRALLESAAFELRHALEEARSIGLPLEQLWMVGGAARSPHWPHILADTMGTPIHLTRSTHGPALGAAVLAARSMNLLDEHPDWVSAVIIEPDQHQTSVYHDIYSEYIHLTGKLSP